MIPARYSPILFALILSAMMTCMVSLIATIHVMGLADGLFGMWVSAWMYSWAVAFPVVLIAAPITRRLVARLVRTEG